MSGGRGGVVRFSATNPSTFSFTRGTTSLDKDEQEKVREGPSKDKKVMVTSCLEEEDVKNAVQG